MQQTYGIWGKLCFHFVGKKFKIAIECESWKKDNCE